MKYYLTGSTGFLGKQFLNQFIKQKKKPLICIVNKIPKKSNPVSYITYKDFLDQPLQNEYILFHVAGQIKGSSKAILNFNFELSKLLLNKCKKEKCRKFIFISSYDVETDKNTIYAKSKLLFESYLIKHLSDKFLIIRPSVIFGKNDNKNFGMLFKFIKTSPVIPLMGETKFRPVYRNDVIQFILDNFESATGIYTLVSSQIVTLKEIIKTYVKANNLKRWIISLPFKLKKPKTKINITKNTNRLVIYTKIQILDWITQDKETIKPEKYS
ncbi:MAG: NAD-dependent epimerase/dehydratase family protein [bacterium]|nr:NAD-dependent epimerase/dehydratase family protein [bacterium]